VSEFDQSLQISGDLRPGLHRPARIGAQLVVQHGLDGVQPGLRVGADRVRRGPGLTGQFGRVYPQGSRPLLGALSAPAVRVDLPTSHTWGPKAMHAARRAGLAFGQFQYPTPPLAVFDEDLVRAYRTFLDNRRSLRPQAEYREPTEQEWRKFQAHFQTRKLELGECGRPYGSTCKHEHSCLRCPSLRLASTARPRLVEIIANLRDRISEAKLNGWFGEVEGLKVSLEAASRKLVSLDRMQDRQPSGPVNLGIPVITDPPPS
jgi:hypothetical protein